MALSASTGRFIANGSTGNQAVSGIGFQPKAIIFFAMDEPIEQSGANVVKCVGFATSSTARSVMAMTDDDGPTKTDIDNDNWSTRCIFLRNIGGTVRMEADFVSFGADGFTVNWINSGVELIFFIAIGGDDLTSVQAGQFTKKTSTGTDPITGVGFEPDLLLIMGELNTTENSTAVDSSFFFGAAVSPTSRWCTQSSSEDFSNDSNCGRSQRTNKILYQSDEAGTAIAEADLDSMDVDGFTLNYSTANGDAHRYAYLALKGGSYFLDAFNGDTSTGNQAVAGVGFTPKLNAFVSFGGATSGSELADSRFMLGAAVSSTERRVLNTIQRDGEVTADNNQDINSSFCLRFFSDTDSSIIAEADFVSQDADGFTVNWSTVDAISREILYLSIGNTSSLTPAATFPDISSLRGRINIAANATGQVIPREFNSGLFHSNQMQKFQTSLEIQTGDPCACTVFYRLLKRADDR